MLFVCWQMANSGFLYVYIHLLEKMSVWCVMRFARAKTLAFDKRHELDDPQPFDAQINAACEIDVMSQYNSVRPSGKHTKPIKH